MDSRHYEVNLRCKYCGCRFRVGVEARVPPKPSQWYAVICPRNGSLLDFSAAQLRRVAGIALDLPRAQTIEAFLSEHCDAQGRPFRFPVFDTAWRTATVTALAHSDRAFDHLPILADALEDAGCTDRTILDHCRKPGEHLRGCWVVDLVLGKE